MLNFKKTQKTNDNLYNKNNNFFKPTANIKPLDNTLKTNKTNIPLVKKSTIENDSKELDSILGKPL